VTPTPEQAAAIAAAIERFLQDTSSAPAPVGEQIQEEWTRVAMLEGVCSDHADVPHPWIAHP